MKFFSFNTDFSMTIATKMLAVYMFYLWLKNRPDLPRLYGIVWTIFYNCYDRNSMDTSYKTSYGSKKSLSASLKLPWTFSTALSMNSIET